jgi:hypothetical protein
VNYAIRGPLVRNTVYFSGEWYSANDSMVAAGSNAKVYLVYYAKSVNVVAQGNSSTIMVFLDGSSSPVASFSIGMAKLYTIVDGQSCGAHELEIVANPGFRLYTFTFG